MGLKAPHVDVRKSVTIISSIDTKTKKERSLCITHKESGVCFEYRALSPKMYLTRFF